jgi:hypothetical protein
MHHVLQQFAKILATRGFRPNAETLCKFSGLVMGNLPTVAALSTMQYLTSSKL